MAYSQDWLESSTAVRCVLVEIEAYSVMTASTVYFYLSNTGYITTSADVYFSPDLTGSVSISESINQEGISVSTGTVNVHNANGEFDDWLDNSKYVWASRSIKIYYGDNTWKLVNLAAVKSSFGLIFDGNIYDITSSDISSIRFNIMDKMERLNSPVSELKIGAQGVWPGGQQNEDQLQPIIIGEVFNVEPVLINPAELEYMFNSGPSERLIEIRDNGVPVYDNTTRAAGATVNLTNSTFKLSKPLAGTCTVSAQGIKKSFDNSFNSYNGSTYRNTIIDAIAVLCTQYGDAGQRLAISELDASNFASFYTTHGYAFGLWLSDRQNIISVCKELAASAGLSLYFNRLGKLQLLRLGTYTTDPIMYITKGDILINTFKPSKRSIVSASVRLNYAKNWTVQQDLLTAIPSDHKEMLGEEWKSVTVEDSAIKSLYKQFGDPLEKDTLIITDVDAQNEANARLGYDKLPHTSYTFTGTTKLMSLKLGQQVNITYDRFGMESGKSAQVTSLNPRWSDGFVDVEITI
jgi:hypothetical protein